MYTAMKRDSVMFTVHNKADSIGANPTTMQDTWSSQHDRNSLITFKTREPSIG